MSFEQFIEATAEWMTHAVYLRGEAIGAILVKGPDIHACIDGHQGEWFRKEHIRILNRVIEQNGFARTHATTPAGEAFVKRLGFEKHGDSYRRETPWVGKH